MRRFIFLLFLPFIILSESITIQPIKVTKREGQNVMDIYYDLPEGYYEQVYLYFSLDMKNYLRAKGQSGAIGEVSPGRNKHIVWNMEADFPTEWHGEMDVVVKIIRGIVYQRINSKGYKEYKCIKDGSILIYIPKGEFTMGSNDGASDEKPVHNVYLDGYFIGKYEVTNRQYKKFCDAAGHSYPPNPGFSGMSDYFNNYPDHPVVEVSWDDVIAYCGWAGLRLPTEAEWEKAARGTDARKYPWGNSEPDAGGRYRANYDPGNYTEDGYRYTSPVGSFSKGISPYGCFNMAGNVWEWCSDWYDEDYYSSSSRRNPEGSPSGACRVYRGGSWFFYARPIRSACRHRLPPGHWSSSLGFRVAR